MILNQIAIACLDDGSIDSARKLSQELKIPLVDAHSIAYSALLMMSPSHLMLKLTASKSPKPIYVDFLEGSLAHRRQYGGGRHQLLARAIGLKKKSNLSVLDLTAGLGRDAFILATLGCDVTMIERHPVVAALLRDGMRRAETEGWFRELKLQLLSEEASDYLQKLTQYPDVIYLDPMYPERTSTALVKKEMRILRAVVGDDLDAASLLVLARERATMRVVVKRSREASYLGEQKPDLIYKGKSSRFDVYWPTGNR